MKKVAVITGGSRGIGAETVKYFAKNGYTVVLNYCYSRSKAQQLQSQLVDEGCDVHLFQADISKPNQVELLFDYVQKHFKHVDVLVNHAGVSGSYLVQDVSETEYNQIMDTNAKGAFFCCKYALPLLKESENASVVNVSSIWGLHGSAMESVYCMSKHAVVGLTKSLALEWDGMINVNCVCPPIVLTDMCADYTAEDVAAFCKETNTVVYKPSQIAKVIFAISQAKASGKVLEL